MLFVNLFQQLGIHSDVYWHRKAASGRVLRQHSWPLVKWNLSRSDFKCPKLHGQTLSWINDNRLDDQRQQKSNCRISNCNSTDDCWDHGRFNTDGVICLIESLSDDECFLLINVPRETSLRIDYSQTGDSLVSPFHLPARFRANQVNWANWDD